MSEPRFQIELFCIVSSRDYGSFISFTTVIITDQQSGTPSQPIANRKEPIYQGNVRLPVKQKIQYSLIGEWLCSCWNSFKWEKIYTFKN